MKYTAKSSSPWGLNITGCQSINLLSIIHTRQLHHLFNFVMSHV